VGGAIRFDGPTGQQQPQNDTENQLFLFRQAVHADNITETGQTATIPFTIYDLGFRIDQAPLNGQIINQKTQIINCHGSHWPVSKERRDILRQSGGRRVIPVAGRRFWFAIV
jgi:hypothetical protein